MKKCLILLFYVLVACNSDNMENEFLIENLMKSDPATFSEILTHPEIFQTQIIYTRIDRDSSNHPSFRTFYYNHEPSRYFYPASTVKLPATILALEKLNRLNISGLDKETIMLTDSAWAGQSPAYFDSSSVSGQPSIGHYIKKILMVSDNDAFNRLYEFIGQKEFNDAMRGKGFNKTRMSHRLEIFLNQEENAHTNPLRFVSGDSLIYSQAMAFNETRIQSEVPIPLGKAHYSEDKKIDTPMNFQFKNFFPLEEQHELLKSLFFEPYSRFNLTEEDRKFIWKYMSQLPSESTYPDYSQYDDHYVKFFMFGDGSSKIPDHIRVFNKVGDAYGFLIDNAYIVDFKNNIEFLISAVIYVNADETLNNGQYEYDEKGLPFFAKLGQLIYNYELEHKNDIVPNLSHLKLQYDN